ncbi:hypothetical protein CDAR_498671 [Caerostris darwini]|uniref:Uncharacterized protein n=1 Tax=Caerostris darwini TaxID=1538125 RepID=A0AAV4SPH7_9ARAC|nr:hypothetical protein CDAR_498671 [Caerostris darwini]
MLFGMGPPVLDTVNGGLEDGKVEVDMLTGESRTSKFFGVGGIGPPLLVTVNEGEIGGWKGRSGRMTDRTHIQCRVSQDHNYMYMARKGTSGRIDSKVHLEK